MKKMIHRKNGKSKKYRLFILILIMLALSAASAGWLVRYASLKESSETDQVSIVLADAVYEAAGDISEKFCSDMTDICAAAHVYSHRGGASGRAEEHTTDAYDIAVSEGSLYLEQDVVASAEGTLYVSHDASAYRLTGTGRDYSSMTDDQIDSLRTRGGKRILKLSDVFDRYRTSVIYVIELKSNDSTVLKSFVDIIDSYGYEKNVIVQSFSAGVLGQLEETFPEMEKLYLCTSGSAAMDAVNKPFIDIIGVKANAMSASDCRAVHEAGKKYNVWTISTEAQIRAAIDAGVDTYFTDDTGLAISIEKKTRSSVAPSARQEPSDRQDKGLPATLFFASDFQAEPGWADPAENLEGILKAAKDDGKSADMFIICGDYTNDSKLYNYQLSPEESISRIKDTVKKYGASEKDKSADSMLFVQGNHDKRTESISESGLHEYDNFLIYILNTEEDFPWRQGRTPGSLAKVKASSEALKKCLEGLVDKGETRPLFIAGHVPLHFTARTSSKHTSGDNMYSSLIFDVVNEAGKSLDIIYMFGHNHSKGWDCYMGGSSVFKASGDSILIPDLDEKRVTTDDYHSETLNFTYMNAGYIGYYMNCGTEELKNGTSDQYKAADDTLTGTMCEIYNDRIVITRYSEDGVHCLGHEGEGDPYKGGIDAGLISSEHYSKKTDSPQTISRR